MLCVLFARGHCFAFRCLLHSSAYLYFLTFPCRDAFTGDFPGSAKQTPTHLFFTFILLIFIFSAVCNFFFFFWQLHTQRQLCSGIFCTGRGKTKTKDHLKLLFERCLWDCVFFCLPPAGSVYLLRRVEAPEAVGHSGEWHLGQPAHIPARAQGGGLALPLLHVRPRRVSPCKIGSPVKS